MPPNVQAAMARAALSVTPLAKAFLREARGVNDTETLPLEVSAEDFLRQLQTGQLDGVLDGR